MQENNSLKILLWIITFSLSPHSQGQNLVPNPSFENLKKPYDCGVTATHATFNELIYDWDMPTEATPDIFTTLSPASCLSHMPHTTIAYDPWIPIGSQMPRTGNNFAAIVPYDWYREYLSVKLISPLIPGEIYCCEMYVCRAENTTLAQNSLGMFFSDTLINTLNMDRLLLEPQIKGEDVVHDTVNWVKISGWFQATSAAEYLLIGNFSPTANVKFELAEIYDAHKFPSTYYYIDDVSVERIVPPPLVITGNDPICPGEEITMKATGWDDIQWVKADEYFREISETDSLTVTPTKTAHTYAVRGYVCDYEFHQEVNVTFKEVPEFDLGLDTLICSGTNLTLDPGPGLIHFVWQDGSTAQTFTASQPGSYYLNASNSDECWNADTIQIGFYTPPVVSLGDDFETCFPEGELNASTGRSYDQYVWNNGTQQPTLPYEKEGTYWVDISAPCSLKASDTIHISKVNMTIPNLITPNQDFHNEQFEIQGIQMKKGKLTIYNRSGSKVYQNDYYSNDWSPEDLSTGIYYYLFEYPTCEAVKGWLHIIE